MDLNELKVRLKENGVVGAGGAGFPSYAKLSEKADTIILNCAECEPLLRLHRQVLERNTFEILSALEFVAEMVGAENIIIGIKASYTDALEALRAQIGNFPNIKISEMKSFYPTGDEVVLIYETTGRVVPPGGIPIAVGVTVFNVETVLNIYNTVKKNKPVTTKYVTVTGEVKTPITLKVPLGITIKELVSLAGGATADEVAYINGGPMMGNLVSPYDVVTKTTNAVVVLPKNHHVINKKTANISIDIKRAMGACCQCRMCTDLCPRNLLGHPIDPGEFMRSATSGNTRNVEILIDTMFCSQCGICEMYACGQGLSPRTLIGEYKAGLRKEGVKVPQDIKAAPVSKAREYRRVPTYRVVTRLGLGKYDRPAPFSDYEYLPKKVKIMLSQHIGAPAKAVVKEGDTVKKGTLLGVVDEKNLGANIHSSVNGKITTVTDKFILIETER